MLRCSPERTAIGRHRAWVLGALTLAVVCVAAVGYSGAYLGWRALAAGR